MHEGNGALTVDIAASCASRRASPVSKTVTIMHVKLVAEMCNSHAS